MAGTIPPRNRAPAGTSGSITACAASYNGTKGSLSEFETDIFGSAGRIRISATTAELYTVDARAAKRCSVLIRPP